jgi:hypothetical protein
MVRPNFTDIRIQNGQVEVKGVSGIEADTGSRVDFQDVVEIRVVLIQGERVDQSLVDTLDPNWTATFEVADPTGASPDFQTGDAVAIGVERRLENATVISWSETLPIT